MWTCRRRQLQFHVCRAQHLNAAVLDVGDHHGVDHVDDAVAAVNVGLLDLWTRKGLSQTAVLDPHPVSLTRRSGRRCTLSSG